MRAFDPNDPRPLRVTLFPEHPQTILIYVPGGQSLWLPELRTPFEIDQVCDVLIEDPPLQGPAVAGEAVLEPHFVDPGLLRLDFRIAEVANCA